MWKGGKDMKVLVAYYSQQGTTKNMAKLISKEIEKEGVEVDLKEVEQVQPQELIEYDGIIIGSPTYYGTCAYQVKKLLDESVDYHSKLDGKVGGAFTSSANIGGGNETTILSILEAMLIHGMIIQGDPRGDHYGPVGINGIDKRCEDNCKRFARRFVELLKKVKRG